MLSDVEPAVAVRPHLRRCLLDAADRLLRERGARGLTTREIAREAGCSEGALYVHFESKAQLLASLCERWLPDLTATIGSLIERVGDATVRENLAAIARQALRAYAEMAPSIYAIAGDPELLRYHRAALKAAGHGPRRGVEAIGAYLAAEQRLGRVRPDADATMAANLLLGACWQRAVLRHYVGEHVIPVDDAKYAESLATTVVQGLDPGGCS